MADVISRVDAICFERTGSGFSERCKAPANVGKMIESVVKTGWLPYEELHRTVSHASYFAFVASLSMFVLTPVGMTVTDSLVYWGGKESIKLLYDHRHMVGVVKDVGDTFRTQCSVTPGESGYDELVNRAAEALYVRTAAL